MKDLQKKRNDHIRAWAKERIKLFRDAGLHAGANDVSELPQEAQNRLEWFLDEHNRLSAEMDELRNKE